MTKITKQLIILIIYISVSYLGVKLINLWTIDSLIWQEDYIDRLEKLFIYVLILNYCIFIIHSYLAEKVIKVPPTIIGGSYLFIYSMIIIYLFKTLILISNSSVHNLL